MTSMTLNRYTYHMYDILVNYVRSMSVLGLYLFIFCISINVISDQQKIFNLIIMFFFCFYDINLSRNSFFLIMFFFPTGFIIFYDLCAVIIIINLLSIYIIKNQRLT